MKTSLSLLAVAAGLAAALVLSQAADAQVQVKPRAGSLAPQPNNANPDGIPTPTPTPTQGTPAAPGGFKAAPTKCLPGWQQVQLTQDAFGHLQYMTCQSPIIECPDPGVGYNVGLDVVKQVVNADDGRFRIQYRCTYYRIQG